MKRKNILADLGMVWECLRSERDNITNCWNLVKVDVTDSERGRPFTREEEAKSRMCPHKTKRFGIDLVKYRLS